MRVLVTGATGFIGNHLVQALLANKISVIATYRNEDSVGIPSWSADVEWRRLDIFDPPPSPFTTLGSPDAMIHLAWHGLPNYNEDFHLTRNLPADRALLGSMITGGLRHLLVTGTCLEYGMAEGELSEDMETAPPTCYAQAKKLLFESLSKLAPKQGCVFQWARLFYTFGEGQNPRSLFAQLQTALDAGDTNFNMSGGQQIRDYLPVKQLANHLVSIVTQRTFSGIINVCSGERKTVLQLVEEYIRAQNGSIALNLGHYPYPDYEPFRFWGDSRKLNMILEAQSHVRSNEGRGA
ncbi:NAD-dependent epimerase/dehydratase family protein [Pseudodesulfovibrio sp. F-1]|uniref:NAD-dependent epimerase/dehydratase family protein n=1 Tax=Pseudodesulfovibrio alkaliphilus TaxID=2661613 RepID=A0A7K1KQD6_9BACT|nr:NAD(P)-dependent oxidoreductase [Pseudodesulfovibrio alkaliphilus]MUM78102.1 NAD-dependent epimerase/dehydratase family protein [Pseudodesulfovibrio alkaliphilus]